MSRKKSSKKLKNSLFNTIQKVFINNDGSKLSHKQVCSILHIKESAVRKLAFSVLEDLVQQKFLKKEGHGLYLLSGSGAPVVGRLELTARGAGFVVLDGDVEDVFVPPNQLNQALSGDLVSVQITKQGSKRREGRIINVIERERTQFVGTIKTHERFAFFIPDNSKVGTDIFIPTESLNGAKNGEKALVRITTWPKSAESPYGEVVERLGGTNVNDVEMISVLVNQGLNYVFPANVLAEAEQVSTRIDEQEVEKRRDFRQEKTFTIDPFDAKDFDDAISYKELENGAFEVGVHIADVSHYVVPGTAMDKEASLRGNSVYLVDRVVPMLPEQLSNLTCSLRPNEDKFTFSAVFKFSKENKVVSRWFGKSIIHSDHRFTYEDAQEIIMGADGKFKDEIVHLDSLASKLRKQRLKAGAMNIESEEVRFKLDESGHPVDVIIKRSLNAHKLVEEFMLLANREVAEYVSRPVDKPEKTPFVYRCHDNPDPEKLASFSLFIDKFGYDIDVTKPKEVSKNINSLLADIRETSEFSLIQSMAIRSMAKAVYDTENIGHYGLGFAKYTHFTSPIRRYSDLIVHRILQDVITKKKARFGTDLKERCKHISRMERKAVEAERESTKFFQTLFLYDKIGDSFTGSISGLTEYGLFIKLDENHCEGFVRLNEIPGDRFYFDKDRFQIEGRKTKKRINLGDSVNVRLYEVNPRKRQIELEILSLN